jgi:hypothetical protein
MMKEHNFSLTELENMIPWEKKIYEGLLLKYLKEKEEQMKKEMQKHKIKSR